MIERVFTRDELISAWNNVGGPIFRKACVYVESLVPKYIYDNGVRLSHHSTYYEPYTKKFAYLKNGKFVYLDLDEVKKLTT